MAGRVKKPTAIQAVFLAAVSACSPIDDPSLHPEFDPAISAFYYVRVLEIPTPRWTAYDAKYYGLELEEDVTVKHQERAYTSPIWYSPN